MSCTKTVVHLCLWMQPAGHRPDHFHIGAAAGSGLPRHQQPCRQGMAEPARQRQGMLLAGLLLCSGAVCATEDPSLHNVPTVQTQALTQVNTQTSPQAVTGADSDEKVPAQDDQRMPTLSGLHQVRLDTMTVVATRTERELFTTPAAVSRLDAADIDEIQPYGYNDLFETLPGIVVQGGPRRIAEEPAIRGFQDEQVVIRIDGTRQSFNQAHRGRFLLDPDLLKSIEVQRGAASAAYGSGALGGVFDIQTKSGRDFTADQDGFGARFKLAYQSNGEEFGSFNTLFAQYGELDFIGSFVYRDVGEDLRDGDNNPILASQDELTNGFIKLGWQPGTDQRLEYAFELFDNEGLNPPNANETATATNLVDRDTERRNHRLRYQWNPSDIDWLDLQVVAYRNEIDVNEFRLADNRFDSTDFVTEGIELFNTSRFDLGLAAPVALTWGVEFYQDKQRGTRDGDDRLQFPDARVDYSAAYVQAELQLTRQLSLIPGLRYDSFDYQADTFTTNRNDNKVTPKVALGFEASRNWYFWSEYAQAFRAPSLTELFADGVHFVVPLAPGQVVVNEFVPTPELQPESAEQVQLGARYRYQGLFTRSDEFSIEFTAFHSDVDDFVDQFVVFISGEPAFDPFTQTLVFPGITSNRNINARFRGIETEMRYDSGSMFAALSLSLLDARQRNSDDRLASTPPDQASLRAGVRLLDRRLTLGGEWIVASDRDNVPDDAIVTAGYGKLDLFTSWTPGSGLLRGFEMRFNVDNLLDKNFRIHPNGINQPGRSFRLSLARTFAGF